MQNKRVRYFVEPAIQGRLLFRIASYSLVYLFALWHAMFFFELLSSSLTHDEALPPKGFWALYGDFAQEHVFVIICFAVMLPLVARDLLKFSHRFVGPWRRFQGVLQQLAAGKPVQPVTLREHDLPDDFLNDFNAMIKAWNARLGEPAGDGKPGPGLNEAA